MRRADRLFQIIQILRRSSRPVTADDIACELEVSLRTIYRDIADLIAQRVPIRGEAGFGYVDDDFSMPPLMLTPDEIEAAVLGAQWVAGRGDPVLARAANDLIAKISAAVPERLRLLDRRSSSIGTRPTQRMKMKTGRHQQKPGRPVGRGWRRSKSNIATYVASRASYRIWLNIIGYSAHSARFADEVNCEHSGDDTRPIIRARRYSGRTPRQPADEAGGAAGDKRWRGEEDPGHSIRHDLASTRYGLSEAKRSRE